MQIGKFSFRQAEVLPSFMQQTHKKINKSKIMKVVSPGFTILFDDTTADAKIAFSERKPCEKIADCRCYSGKVA